ncbi:helix-turn-helix domain-containing protein [Spirillospora sp. NBC_01491]|uniref:helix-turn-helix domain-containing protein n=1 Tax=Spirillospora sp. NBC_01491 TaxID=2976007 RepID=UPI002E335234|nr:helix-turn-helix domain-containing protein [Spirillospora sp. NBC_01491]
MQIPPETGDLDLAAVTTVPQLKKLLGVLRLRAGLSLRALEQASAGRLTKTRAAEAVNGARPPSRETVEDFVRTCGVPEDQITPWVRAWERANVPRNVAPPDRDDFRAEAEHILDLARAEAVQIVDQARAEAEHIVGQARTEARADLTHIDAVMPVPDGTDTPREYWLFSGERYLRVSLSSLGDLLQRRLTDHSPLHEWAGTFKRLPEFRTKIDMVLGVPDNRHEYWVFSGDQYIRIHVADTENGIRDELQEGPKPLSDWGRTFGAFSDLDRIDTAMPVPEAGEQNQYWVFTGSRYLRTWVKHGLDGQINIHPTGFDGWSDDEGHSFLKGWPGTFNRVSPFSEGIDAVIPLPPVKNGEEEYRDYWVFSDDQYMKIRVIAHLYSDTIIQFPAALGG